MTSQGERVEHARQAVEQALQPYWTLYNQFGESEPDLPSRADARYKRETEMARLLRGVSKHFSGSVLVERAIPLARGGDWEAWTVCSMALRHPDHYPLGDEAHRRLMAFAADAMDGLVKVPKRRKPSQPIRNRYILLAIGVAESFGLPSYSGGESRGATACEIVAEKLNIKAEAVTAILQNYRKTTG